MWTGRLIKILRIAHGISQKELASRLKVSRPYLSQVENNRKQPGLKFLRNAVKLFNVDTALFFLPESIIDGTKYHDRLLRAFSKAIGKAIGGVLAKEIATP